jgi:DNA polymerase-3 subunit delta
MNNLHLIIGDNKENNDFYLQDILKKINTDEDNIIRYDLSESSFNDILDEASMISLFSNIKVIIGINFDISKISDNENEYLSKYLDNINKDVYIILITSKIDARLKTYKLFKDNFNIIETSKTNNKDDILKYINNKCKDNKFKIDNANIEYFLNKVGNDINNINSELDKLFIYKNDDKIITRNDIDLLVTDNIDNIIYEFTNAFLENDYDLIIKMYNNFKLENVSFDYLITSLSNVLRQAITIKLLANDNKSNFEIAKFIGKKEFFVKKMLERLYQYTINDLAKYITKLAKIDANFKSGKSNIDELELFLIDKDK